jgi:hypothetical protein
MMRPKKRYKSTKERSQGRKRGKMKEKKKRGRGGCAKGFKFMDEPF